MSTFDNTNIDIPQHSPWHLLTGSIVMIFGSLGGFYSVAWLLLS